ncbi:recombinase family protein [Blautia ammoniilytica]|uniref:Recombinase family protein n=3 Tax=Blautia TaxID=572511 RepID=A0ABT2TY29_9FIRM|nr:recombinase family protein [uncultured Blautia sp.]MCU6767140.1 recombinase family protein [Blautia ammoniilytica]SCJ04781.1 Transposon Tn1000 resolvase [uncultured Blautia sp.]
MKKEKIKVYLYTRVSTTMQIDGYSLDAQKTKMKAFCDYNEYEIAGEYEDARKSGKSIEGRVSFNQMMEDIKSGKDGVSYVLVFKLSRFGRNAADVLATLQVMQDFGVNLICVEDGIDSSKDAGKLMISVLSAVAEIERENIRVQTMEGRMQKAREGKWNGGFAPYGYSLIDGKLEVNEEEAVAIRMIFDKYVNTDLGANGIAKYLENHGIHKIARQNGKNPLFDAALIRRIIQNPVYSGKISYGRRRTEKVHGTRNEYRQVKKDDYLLVDGLHEALVSEEVWEQAQVKVAAQAKKYEKVNRDKREKIHLLSGILKCPVCGAGMYGNKSIKKRKDGSNYKDFYYYGCKHRNMTRGHKCDYKKQVHEEMLDASVAEVISKLVSNPKFSDLIRNKINMEVDTSALDQEIENYKIQLRKLYHNKDTILSDMDSLDYEDKHYQRRKTDLENHLYKTYDKIDDAEELLVSAKAKKRSLLADKITGDNIYKALVFFDKLYAQMNEAEKREFLSQLVDNVQIYEERKENGQWLKSIEFKLPIIEKEFTLSLDNDTQNETVVLLSQLKQKPDDYINVTIELDDMDITSAETKATYDEIKKYVAEHNAGMKVSNLYISQVKRKCGIEVGKNYNLPKNEDSRQPQCPEDKESAIVEALKHFKMNS